MNEMFNGQRIKCSSVLKDHNKDRYCFFVHTWEGWYLASINSCFVMTTYTVKPVDIGNSDNISEKEIKELIGRFELDNFSLAWFNTKETHDVINKFDNDELCF